MSGRLCRTAAVVGRLPVLLRLLLRVPLRVLQRVLQRVLLAVLLLAGAAPAAWAGRSCEAQPLQTSAVTQGMALAQRTATALEASGAQVLLGARRARFGQVRAALEPPGLGLP